MRKVYYYPLCPFSRQVRIVLKELNLVFSLVKEDFWLKNKEFSKISKSGEVPVLIEPNGTTMSDIFTIFEYLYETEKDFFFLNSKDPVENIQVRSIFFWCNNKFYREVVKIILDEKLIRLLKNAGPPRTDFLRIAQKNQKYHLNYLSSLLQSHSYLAADRITLADVAAASHISVLDYFNEIIWEQYPVLKNWYSLIKSRSSFRPLLQDILPGLNPPNHYTELDF